jgi:hypothetical protein
MTKRGYDVRLRVAAGAFMLVGLPLCWVVDPRAGWSVNCLAAVLLLAARHREQRFVSERLAEALGFIPAAEGRKGHLVLRVLGMIFALAALPAHLMGEPAAQWFFYALMCTWVAADRECQFLRRRLPEGGPGLQPRAVDAA